MANVSFLLIGSPCSSLPVMPGTVVLTITSLVRSFHGGQSVEKAMGCTAGRFSCCFLCNARASAAKFDRFSLPDDILSSLVLSLVMTFVFIPEISVYKEG